jgi:hypothetical protein
MARTQAGRGTAPGHSIIELNASDSALALQQGAARPEFELKRASPNQQTQPEAESRSNNVQPTEASLSDEAWYDVLVENGVSPLIAKARVRHRRDLPALLVEHPGKLVAYSGDERIAIGGTATELVETCMQRGLNDDEFLLEAILPEDDSVIDAAMWAHI